jgi:hypothetical protein
MDIDAVESKNKKEVGVLKVMYRQEVGMTGVDTVWENSITEKITKTKNTFGQFEQLSSDINKIGTGPIRGIINSNPYSKTGAQIKAEITALIPGLARGTYGEVGVLTDQDVENYKKTVPNLSTPESAKGFIFAMTTKILTNSLKNLLVDSAKANWDVSEFAPDLIDLQKRADEMIAQQQAQESIKKESNAGKWWNTIFGENKTTKVDPLEGIKSVENSQASLDSKNPNLDSAKKVEDTVAESSAKSDSINSNKEKNENIYIACWHFGLSLHQLIASLSFSNSFLR